MKRVFLELDDDIKEYLFPSTKNIKILNIVQLRLEEFDHLTLLGLFYKIGQEMTLELIYRRYDKKTIRFSVDTIEEIVIGIKCDPPSIRRQPINKSLRSAVWTTYLNPDSFSDKCWCCKYAIINRDNFQSGHVISVAEGGDSKLENLRPICNTCNTSMSTKNMINFIEECGFQNSYCNLGNFMNWIYK